MKRHPVFDLVGLMLWLGVLLLALHFLLDTVRPNLRPTPDFGSYYTAARLLRQGADVSRFYEEAWFGTRVGDFFPGLFGVFFGNPPTMPLLGLPLTLWAGPTAAPIWATLNLISLTAAVALLIQRLHLGRLWGAVFAGYTLLYHPVHSHVAHGQAYLIILGVFVLIWTAFRDRHDRGLGVLLGALLTLKLSAVMVGPILLVQRRWRALGWASVLVLVVVLLTLPWLGLTAWQAFAAELRRIDTLPSISITAYQTTTSFFRHLFIEDAVWNPAPLAHAPSIGLWGGRLVFVALLAISLVRAATARQPDLVLAMAVALNTILSPVSLEYHYPLLLLPVAILLAWARLQRSLRVWGVLALAMWLLAADLDYRSVATSVGWASLLGYPRLYGASLVWGLCIWGMGQVEHGAVTAKQMPTHQSLSDG